MSEQDQLDVLIAVYLIPDLAKQDFDSYVKLVEEKAVSTEGIALDVAERDVGALRELDRYTSQLPTLLCGKYIKECHHHGCAYFSPLGVQLCRRHITAPFGGINPDRTFATQLD